MPFSPDIFKISVSGCPAPGVPLFSDVGLNPADVTPPQILTDIKSEDFLQAGKVVDKC